MTRRTLGFFRPALSNKPLMFAVVAVCIALASFIVLAAARDSPIFSRAPVLTAGATSQGDTCRSARAFAEARIFADNFRMISLGECETLSMEPQDDGGWIVGGAAGATQYRAPVTVQWLVRTDPAGRICGYGSGTRGYQPKLLKVAGCDE